MTVSSMRPSAAKSAAAAPSLDDAANGQALIRRGMSGASVQDLQRSLNARGAHLDVDGKFGPATQQALEQFQATAGVAVDGVVGPSTAAALRGSATTDAMTKAPLAHAGKTMRAPTPEELAKKPTGLRAAELAQANPARDKRALASAKPASATSTTKSPSTTPPGPSTKSAPTAKTAGTLDVGAAGLSPGLGYENSITKLYKAQSPAAAAQALLEKHGDAQPQIVLNEVSKSLASSTGTDGARYRSWLVQLAKNLTSAGKQVIVCSPVSGDANIKSMFQNLAKIPGVRLGMETQVTGKDDAATVREKLTHTLDVMRGIGIEPGQLVHVANLATTTAKKNFGSDGGTQKQFSANIVDEVEEAKALGFGDVLGYGFHESQATQNAWATASSKR